MRILITGAASGIGRAVALRACKPLPDEGEPFIALLDRDEERLSETAELVRREGARCVALPTDLVDPQQITQAVGHCISELGGLDALISNAGIIARGELLSLSVDDFDRSIHINTRAAWLLGRAAHPALSMSHGALVTTASVSALHPTVPLGAYSASKAALVMLVKQMALEWAASGIRCNSVSPGPTFSAMTRESFGESETDLHGKANRSLRELLIPRGRLADPAEVAEAIMFLAGPRAANITGADLAVDGGLGVSLMRAQSTDRTTDGPTRET